MELDELAARIARMVQRTAALREQVMLEREPSKLLSQALEELTVAEKELREQNALLVAACTETERERRRYRDLFVRAPLGYVVTDSRGTILEINQSAAIMLAPDSATLIGIPLARLVAAADREDWRRLLERAQASGGQAVADVHMRTVGGAGWFRCRAHVALERDANGDVAAMRFILLDTTTEERAQLAEQLSEEAQRKDEFLAMLAHELRNPLAPIRSAVELWRYHAEGLTVEQKRWSVEVVARQADHLAHLVDDLLDVSRVSHGKIRLRRAIVDLREVVDQAQDSLHVATQLHKVTYELSSDPVYVDGDVTRLRQIVVNLVDNAIKYTPKGRRISVRVHCDDTEAAIDVQDEGVGLQPEQLESIFALFSQGSSSLARSQGGLGLGLTLVRRLVELHDGTVHATSDGLGKGSTFHVRLPRAEPAAKPLPPSKSQEMMLGGRKILVVDDNVDAAEMLATLLEAEGHKPVIAYDGAGAMEAFEQNRPEVVLLDLGLPDLDGLEVARHLRARSADVLLCALTGYGDESMRARSRESGFDHHLLKPVDFDALRSVLMQRRGNTSAR